MVISHQLAASLPRQSRGLTLHSQQSQKILKEYGIEIPRGGLARTPEEVQEVMEKIGKTCFIKAQVPSLEWELDRLENGEAIVHPYKARAPFSGRDKAGRLLGQKIAEDGKGKGFVIRQVHVCRQVYFWKRWILSIAIDRETCAPVLTISKGEYPDAENEDEVRTVVDNVTRRKRRVRVRHHINLPEGITRQVVREATSFMDPGPQANVGRLLLDLHKVFTERDLTLLEVNSLVQSKTKGQLTSLASKLIVDNAAAERQPDLFRLRNEEIEVPEEMEAEKHKIVYVKLDGNVGTMVNGAGLAMATNDAIGYYGGASANFMDVGGLATKDTMQRALGIVLKDERVKSVLINIYGGLTRCDMIAESIIEVAREMKPSLPIVVRLQGTNSPEGLKLLEDADLGLHVESDFGRAAEKAVGLANPRQGDVSTPES